jgi:hypothetical protein
MIRTTLAAATLALLAATNPGAAQYYNDGGYAASVQRQYGTYNSDYGYRQPSYGRYGYGYRQTYREPTYRQPTYNNYGYGRYGYGRQTYGGYGYR